MKLPITTLICKNYKNKMKVAQLNLNYLILSQLKIKKQSQ